LIETAERANQKGDRWALGLAVRYLAMVLAALVRRGSSRARLEEEV